MSRLAASAVLACSLLTACAQGDPALDDDPTAATASPDGKADFPDLATSGALVGLGGKCMNVYGAFTADGTRVIAYDCVGLGNEMWTYTSSNQRITGLAGKCLQRENGATAAGTKLVIATCNNLERQRFTATTRGLSTSALKSGGRCVAMPADQNGSELVMRDCASSADQTWQWEPVLTMKIQAVLVADRNGTRAPETVDFGRSINAWNLDTWVYRMNQTYLPTHLQFSFDPRDMATVWDDDVNDLTCDSNNPASSWNAIGKAQAIAARYPGKIVVFFRNGPTADRETSSCSSGPTVGGGNNILFQNFFDNRNILAHEMGHYLGLDHPFVATGDDGKPINTYATLKAYLAAHGNDPNSLDGDSVSDTPPSPGPGYWTMNGWDVCTGPATITVGGVTITPDRSNTMDYFGCGTWHFSRKQIQKMRAAVSMPARRVLIETPPPAGSPREIFGFWGRCLSASATRPALGTLVQMNDCTRATNQLWKFTTAGQITLSGLCLSQGPTGGEGARPELERCDGSAAQRWTRGPYGDLISNSAECLEVTGSSSANYSGVSLRNCKSARNQKWWSFFQLPESGPPR